MKREPLDTPTRLGPDMKMMTEPELRELCLAEIAARKKMYDYSETPSLDRDELARLVNAWSTLPLPASEAILAALNAERAAGALAERAKWATPRPRSEWDEGDGVCLWWAFPVDEPPYSGDPRDIDFPGYVTHWTTIPEPKSPGSEE